MRQAELQELDLFYDYRTRSVDLLPKWQKFLQDHQPKSLIFWGQNDIFLLGKEVKHTSRISLTLKCTDFDSGHFAVEDFLMKLLRALFASILKKYARRDNEMVVNVI